MGADDDVLREFGTDLARDAMSTVAPGELDIFDDVAEEYWADPDAAVASDHRDEQLGFGIELAMLAPFAIAVATGVGKFLLELFASALADEAKPLLSAKLRALLRRKSPTSGPSPLTPAQFAQVRTVALETAQRLGLATETAHLLSDAIVGGLVPPQASPSGSPADGRPAS